MNRRSFLRSVLLGAAALALPWKGKAAESEPAVSVELADSIGDVFGALDDLDEIDMEVAKAMASDWINGFNADMLHLAELDPDDGKPDWLSQVQPQGPFEERAREYIEQMRQVAEEYVRIWGDFAEA